MTTSGYDPYGQLAEPLWGPIGKYVFKFGLLERMVDDTLSVAMGVSYDKIGMYVASEMDFLTKCKLIASGIRGEAPGSVQQSFAGFIRDLEEQNTFRNSLVHGAWTGHSDSDHEHGIWSKDGLSRRYNSKPFHVTTEALKENAEKLDELIAKIRQALPLP